MSFMFNPHPFDDPRCVNYPTLTDETVRGLAHGTPESIERLAAEVAARSGGLVIAIDGFPTTPLERVAALLRDALKRTGRDVIEIDVGRCFRDSSELDSMLLRCLPSNKEADPVDLYGMLFDG